MNEADFIKALGGLPLHPGARDLADDCAVLSVGGETLVITHDMMAEGTHFRGDADMADVAWKLVATNLSDLAAKGAEPVGVLIGHMLGRDDDRFIKGLHEALEAFDVPLLGGDTIAGAGPRALGLTAIGRATHVPVPARSGARPGDHVYLTGPVGRSMLGFEGDPDHLAAFNRPMPRLSEGRILAPYVTAMMDVSDGLLLDGWRMANASKVTIALDREAIPVADPARRDSCIRWGDDYELLFTAPPSAPVSVAAHRIGTVTACGGAPLLLGEDALSDPASLGYRHG
ncbi:thiamine-phosphate kinase [Porphyrobacter sp. HT-58-2]|uniref:thiamine-phosphate kinase n=1 Tax=Porphyrobacter sp. HT-58-2 TaxID=2023229 RepID=UPI000CDCDA32|nr:thiamine-phosphate kinase [Porphyrobacter sp. HT-58-2]AUX69395.1 thiamine-phosphate kinase [Porphyrobacter sp. HT-58-2]